MKRFLEWWHRFWNQPIVICHVRTEVPDGWMLVPIEMTPQMHKACKDALYRYIYNVLPPEARAEYEPRQYPVDSRLKRNLRWKAILEAVEKSQRKAMKERI